MDFAGPAKDGWEVAWPFRYKDLKPYYDQVDQLIGVCGGPEDLDVLPADVTAERQRIGGIVRPSLVATQNDRGADRVGPRARQDGDAVACDVVAFNQRQLNSISWRGNAEGR